MKRGQAAQQKAHSMAPQKVDHNQAQASDVSRERRTRARNELTHPRSTRVHTRTTSPGTSLQSRSTASHTGAKASMVPTACRQASSTSTPAPNIARRICTRTRTLPAARPTVTTLARHKPASQQGSMHLPAQHHNKCQQSSTKTSMALKATRHRGGIGSPRTLPRARAYAPHQRRALDQKKETGARGRWAPCCFLSTLSKFRCFVSLTKLVAPRSLIVLPKAEGPTRQLCSLCRSTRELWLICRPTRELRSF